MDHSIFYKCLMQDKNVIIWLICNVVKFLTQIHSKNIVYGNIRSDTLNMSFDCFPQSYFEKFTVTDFCRSFEFS